MSADPTLAPVVATLGRWVHADGVWQWYPGHGGRPLPTVTNEQDLLDEIVRLRGELAATRVEAEHWWHEAVTR